MGKDVFLHSGLIRFFSKRVMSQSDGTALRRSASETADCRISRIAAGSARVLHAAASKTGGIARQNFFVAGSHMGRAFQTWRSPA